MARKHKKIAPKICIVSFSYKISKFIVKLSLVANTHVDVKYEGNDNTPVYLLLLQQTTNNHPQAQKNTNIN